MQPVDGKTGNFIRNDTVFRCIQMNSDVFGCGQMYSVFLTTCSSSLSFEEALSCQDKAIIIPWMASLLGFPPQVLKGCTGLCVWSQDGVDGAMVLFSCFSFSLFSRVTSFSAFLKHMPLRLFVVFLPLCSFPFSPFSLSVLFSISLFLFYFVLLPPLLSFSPCSIVCSLFSRFSFPAILLFVVSSVCVFLF